MMLDCCINFEMNRNRYKKNNIKTKSKNNNKKEISISNINHLHTLTMKKNTNDCIIYDGIHQCYLNHHHLPHRFQNPNLFVHC